jgi:cyclic 2,3-diphosphoglycerate synthetase
VSVRAIALIDGEHYAPVVRDALDALPYDVVAALLVGGTEKLRGGDDYGVPLVEALDAVAVDLVVDLSDEPVLGPRERMLWASRALALGLPYVGADFRFDPPQLEPFELPSVSVIGTGKRVGKTAVTGHLARLLALDRSVIVVAMGRGGPPEPELIAVPPTVAELVARSRAGRHAASDHLETAATCGVPTIGCRRAGGGLAGAVFTSNVQAGARLAVDRRPDVVIFDGSGAAIPPVATDRRILVVGPAQDAGAYLNTYRRLISDLVIAVNCDVDDAMRVTLRLRPMEPLSGRVAVFTAGGADVSQLEADIVAVSTNLGDRAALQRDLVDVDAETYLVEVKAAAIDVVAEHAIAHDRRVVLAANDVVALEGDLDAALLELVPVRIGAL